MRVTILGDCPSKKNSRILSFRGSRPMSFPNGNYKSWHRDASKQLLAFKSGLPSPLTRVNGITIKFYPKTKRGADLSNKAESVMDLLVDNGFLADDNWFVVSKLLLEFGDVDPKNPRVEIEIV